MEIVDILVERHCSIQKVRVETGYEWETFDFGLEVGLCLTVNVAVLVFFFFLLSIEKRLLQWGPHRRGRCGYYLLCVTSCREREFWETR